MGWGGGPGPDLNPARELETLLHEAPACDRGAGGGVEREREGDNELKHLDSWAESNARMFSARG